MNKQDNHTLCKSEKIKTTVYGILINDDKLTLEQPYDLNINCFVQEIFCLLQGQPQEFLYASWVFRIKPPWPPLSDSLTVWFLIFRASGQLCFADPLLLQILCKFCSHPPRSVFSLSDRQSLPQQDFEHESLLLPKLTWSCCCNPELWFSGVLLHICLNSA